MWLASKIDKPQKENLFESLVSECNTIVPGARLSYKLRNSLEKLGKKQRQEIVSKKANECAPLFIACRRGNVEVVDYLITVCGADVEQKGRYEVSDDKSVHRVTPLWCAAVVGKLPVVKSLIRHGADVNSVSDTGSSPVRSACFMTHFDIVAYLVQHGADITKSNYNGGTCLINSVQNAQLCNYLIKKGADVNAQDIQNKSALHYAIQEYRLETTKLLLDHGAEPMLKSKFNDDALQIACIKGAYQIFDYLLKAVFYPPDRIADSYELIGSTFLDEHRDMNEALQYWRKAANLRLSYHIEKKTLPPSKPFNFHKEFETLEELEEIALEQDATQMQSLLICERVLGPSHKDMMYRLMYRGAAFADSLQYQSCIDLWLYALKIRKNNDTILFAETCFTAQALVRLYIDMIEKHKSNVLRTTVRFEDAFEVLEMISSDLPEAIRLLKIHPVYKRQQTSFDIILKVFTHIIFVLLHIELSDEQKHKVAVIVNKILKLNPRTCDRGLTLLHLSVTRLNIIYQHSILEDLHMTPFPSKEVVHFLLICGADVNSRSLNNGESPLYVSSHPKNYEPQIIDLLIKYGAHIDQASHLRETPYSYLVSNPDCQINLASLITLQCLAAQKVKALGIPYQGEVPVTLESFIEMH